MRLIVQKYGIFTYKRRISWYLHNSKQSEIRLTKINTEWHHLYGESNKFFKSQTHRNRVEWWLPGTGWVGGTKERLV